MIQNSPARFVFIFLIISVICIAQEKGGPYTPDENTILLMHFDNDLNLTGQISGTASAITNPPIYESSMSNFGNCLYINNASSPQCITIPGSALLNMGNDWTVEMWIKIGNNGSGSCEYPTIFIKDGDGFPSIFFGLDRNLNGFNAGITLEDRTELSINQNSPVLQNKWYHLCFICNGEQKTLSFVIHNEDWESVFKQTKLFPEGNNSRVYHDDNKELLIGGVSGGSNIQFDGWIDELRISNCSLDLSTPLPSLYANSSLAEFFAEGQNTDYWNDVSKYIDNEIMELLDYWDRPSLTPIINVDEKVKIYLTDRNTLYDYAGTNLPKWKLGYYNTVDKSICLAIPIDWSSEKYYGSFNALLKNTIGQLILKLRFERDNVSNTPAYFMESFGLYRGGLKPDINNILNVLNTLGRPPVLNDIADTSLIAKGTMKDLAVSYIEAQLLTIISYQRVYPGTAQLLWQKSLQYFYNSNEQQRIKLRYQTEHFDLYLAEKDVIYAEAVANKLEEKLNIYSNLFEMTIHNKINCVIYPDPEAGKQCNNTDMYNGGSGWGGDKLDILSPDYFEGGLQGVLDFLIPHEFFHVFHFHMLPNLFAIPAYYFEGLANFMAQGKIVPSTEDDLWKIKELFKNFDKKFHREPFFDEILNNSYSNDPEIGDIDCYFFGETFYNYYLFNGGSYINLKKFFNSVCVWDNLGIQYVDFEIGYLNYLKQLGGIINDVSEYDEIPLQLFLSQNYPNPFNPSTKIYYAIPQRIFITLKVFDVLGKEISTLVNEEKEAGNYEITFNTNNLSSGIYFYQMRANDFIETKKMILIR